MKIKERRITKAVRIEYNCDYPCNSFNECIFGGGCNTAYDCEECGADEYRNGYLCGAMEQHQIDIEKACEALYGLANDIGCDLMDIDKAQKYMRKAMEKE